MIRNDQEMDLREGCPHEWGNGVCTIQDDRWRKYYVSKGKPRLAEVHKASCRSTFICPMAWGREVQDYPRCYEVYI